MLKNCTESSLPVICAADRKVFNPSANPSDNRLSSADDYVFDSAGNMTGDPQGRTFICDAQNKQVEVKDDLSQTIGKYWYDGDGKRIKKYVPATGETTVFVYDAAGKLIADYSTELAPDPKVSYTTADHLGSPRILTDENGEIISRRDFHPFGEEIATTERTAVLGYQPDDIRQKFTTYERDSETDLDFAQARMYSKSIGRFTTVDPLMASAAILNPQTYNRYIYVGNNPINIIDPTGEIWGVNKEGVVAWFDSAQEMIDAGFTVYILLYAYVEGTDQMVALHPDFNLAVDVASTAVWFAQQVAWRTAPIVLAPGAAALAGVSIAMAFAVLVEIIDPSGRYLDGLHLPEPVREFRGTQPKYWEKFLNRMEKIKEKEAALSRSKSGESSPADPNSTRPNPENNKPDSRKPNEPFFKTDEEAAKKAKELGYVKIRERSGGQAVFRKGRNYITRDSEGHTGGAWKMADSVRSLGSKRTRKGTYDENLNRIGP